jgi:hypothetical protein
MRPRRLTCPHVRSLHIVALLVGSIAVPPAVTRAQVPAALAGTYNRRIPEGFAREILELQRDGSYTSGICGIVAAGWCTKRQATASIVGGATIRGHAVSFARGLVHLRSFEGTTTAPESYRWRVDPLPHGRVLYLTRADGRILQFVEMPAQFRPTWVKRTDR